MNGILIIDKPKGITSRDVVNKVINKFNTKKVGHTGTLDPLATGVLVVCIGKSTKLVNELTSTDKEYIASVKLGIKTDTLDSMGSVLFSEDVIKTKEEIKSVLNSFIGSYEQEVPMYSAVKINGKKLYEYAREGINIELPKRKVEIKEIELLDEVEYKDNKTLFKFRCVVSKGTYIRSLINDIAYKLDTIGIMTNLRRVRQGIFKIEDSVKLEDVTINNLKSIIDILPYKKVEITDNIRKKILNGAMVDNIYNTDTVLFMENNEAVALYKISNDKNKLKSYIMFKGGNLWHLLLWLLEWVADLED